MTRSLLETIQKIVREEMNRVRVAELAVVQEIHPHAGDGDTDNYSCSVVLRNSGIVLKQVPVATQRIGTAAVPEPGNLVLVQFVGGDLNAPIITGCLYNDEDRPPVNDQGKAVWHLPLDATDDDAVHAELISGDQRELVLNLGKGLALNLRDDDPVVELSVDGGKATVTIARDGAISIESNGDLSVKANGVQIKGTEINIEADSQLNLKGGVINLN